MTTKHASTVLPIGALLNPHSSVYDFRSDNRFSCLRQSNHRPGDVVAPHHTLARALSLNSGVFRSPKLSSVWECRGTELPGEHDKQSLSRNPLIIRDLPNVAPG